MKAPFSLFPRFHCQKPHKEPPESHKSFGGGVYHTWLILFQGLTRCSAPPSPHQETHETQEAYGEACGYVNSPANYLKCFQEHILIDYTIVTTSLTMSLLSLLSLLVGGWTRNGYSYFQDSTVTSLTKSLLSLTSLLVWGCTIHG